MSQTSSKNLAATAKGRLPWGVRKLSYEARLEVARLYRTGKWTQQRLADRFGVSQTTIRRIVSGGE